MDEILSSMNINYGLIIIGVQLVVILIIIVILSKTIKRLKGEHITEPMVQETEQLLYKNSAKLHIGKRANQEDCIEILDPYKQKMNVEYMAILCDGMGGIDKGEVASAFAVSEMKKIANGAIGSQALPDLLRTTTQNISSRLYELSLQGSVPGGIGTTLVAVVMEKGNLYWSTVGDSKLYLYRYNTLAQINQQHNYLYTLLDEVGEDQLSRKDAFGHEDGEKLISYLGQKEVKVMDINSTPFKLQHKDILILCSDGVFGTLSDREMAGILEINRVEDVANEIIKKVLSYNKEHQDNMSVIALEYLGH